MSEMPTDKALDIIERIDKYGTGLNRWEENFIEDVRSYCRKFPDQLLTEARTAKLEEIYENRV